MPGPLAGVAASKSIGIALTWRETQGGVPIAFQGSFKFVVDVESSQKIGIPRPCGINFGSRIVHETERGFLF